MLQVQKFTSIGEVAPIDRASDIAASAAALHREPIRVLRIAHASLTPALRGRERALARCFPNISLEVVVPPRWREAEVEVEAEADEYFPVKTARTFLSKHIQMFLYDPRPIIEALKRHQPHIVDMNHEPYSVPCAEVLTLCRLYAPKTHVVMQTAQNILKKYPFPFSAMEKRAFKRVSAAYMCSATVQEVLENKNFRKPMKVIPFGVDLEMFQPIERLPNKTVTISYIGRLLPAKGLHVLIDALAQIKSENWKLLIVGDGPERAATENRIKKHGLKDRCELTGAVSYNDTPLYFQKTDVLVVPTITTGKIREQFGRVIVEAMACRVPVVGSTCGAIPEVIADAGIVVPENNSEALAIQLRRIVRDEKLRNELAAAGRERVETHYTWERVAEQIYSVYLRVLNESGN